MSRFLFVFTVWSVNVAAQKYPKYLGSNGGSPRYEPYQPNQQIALPSNGGLQTGGGGPNEMVTGGGMATEVWPTKNGNSNQVNNPLAGGNANKNVENLWQQQNSGMGTGSPNGVLYDVYRQYTGPVDHYVNVAPNIYDPSTMSTAVNAPNYLPPSMAMEPASGQLPGLPGEQFVTNIGRGQGVDIAVGNGNTLIQGRGANPIGNGNTIDKIHVGGQVYDPPMVDASQGIINSRGYPGQMFDIITGNGGSRNIETLNPGSIDAIFPSHFPENGVQNAMLVIPISLDQLLEQSPGTGSVLAQIFDPNIIGCQGPNCGTSPGLSLPLSAGSAMDQGSGSFIEVVDQLTDPRAIDSVVDPGFAPGVTPEIITNSLYPSATNQIMESQPSYQYKTKNKYSKPTYNKRLYSKPKRIYGSYGQTYEHPISYSKPMYRSKQNMYEKPNVKYRKTKVFYKKGYNKPTKYTKIVNHGKPYYSKRKTYSRPRKYYAKSSYSKGRSYKKKYKKGGY
ncbi:unnamed protein product [Mytilus coruscus]|uniref:Uncharacterized protein n=1 Tax=Mytilus coruscus TaxID=42192 RepID=A0A6J8B7A4_MYTCO|nr:unnamed protein product [Mytilus coruscus]